ncbi:MAG: hypothetical protein J7L16_07620 [Deltaproteobacteria bacterium]|nr:hypothetical protein [Deltaproteobacteria bacterium]
MDYIARTGQQTFKSITVPNSRPSKDKVLKQFESFGGYYSGYTVAKHLAVAARAVYSATKVYEGNMEQEEWPQGCEPIGDGFYGLEKQKMMKSKIIDDSV